MSLGRKRIEPELRDPRELRSARELLSQDDVSAVIFGHTHHEIDGAAPDAPVASYFNTGTWTPRLDLRRADIAQMLRAQTFPLEALRDRSLFDVRLMYAVVEQTERGAGVELREITPV